MTKVAVSFLVATLVGVSWCVYVARKEATDCGAALCREGVPVHFEEGCFCVERPTRK